MSDSLQPHALYSLLGSSVHGDSPGKNIGVDCYALLQGIFPTQGLNSGLLHCRQILYHLSYQEAQTYLWWGGAINWIGQKGFFCFYGEGNGTPLQYSCLENPMDRGAW